MTYQKAISKRIIELCMEKQITLEVLARNAKISTFTLQNLINKKIDNLNLNTMQKICSSLNMQLKDFFDSSLFDLENLKK